MSKIIKMREPQIEELLEEFKEALASTKMKDGKISFTKTFEDQDRKATVYFSEIAWLKMSGLVRECDKEISWNGVATRLDEDHPEKDEYYIYDIVVPPQYVTGATVTTDQGEFEEWLDKLDDDTFNHLRMQGHSHVNMGVTPSCTDEELYENLLFQVDDCSFYIFLILNKKGDYTCRVYDLKTNCFFDTKECELKVIEEENGVQSFLREAMDSVKSKVFTKATKESKTNQTTGRKSDYASSNALSYSGYGGKKKAKIVGGSYGYTSYDNYSGYNYYPGFDD